MRGYCDNFLLDSATYIMDDKIGDYINIYELEKIQAGKTVCVYVAFNIDEIEENYYMTFDMGYMKNDIKGKIYVSNEK